MKPVFFLALSCCFGGILNAQLKTYIQPCYQTNTNEVTVTNKKDASKILTGNLAYDTANKKLKGIYGFQILSEFATGCTAKGVVDFEINLYWFLKI